MTRDVVKVREPLTSQQNSNKKLFASFHFNYRTGSPIFLLLQELFTHFSL